MSAMKAGPVVPTWLAAGVLGIVLGGVGGFYGARWVEKSVGNAPTMGGGGGGLPGGAPGGMGGGGGGGGAQEHPNAAALVRTVGNLVILEKASGKGLTAEQRQKLSGVTAELSSSDTLTEAQCEAQLQKINAVLFADQQTVLEDLTPRFGRGGGGGGRPGGPPGGGMAGNTPGANTPGANSPGRGPGGNSPGRGPGGGLTPTMMGGGGGGMGGGARTDWERPFKEGRGRERLEELAGLLKK